jgi:diguanylate cyclase (GGDEF)-like protein/PAS domain S-box-containing protein
LQESEKRMSAIFQYSPLGIMVGHLANGNVLSVNDSALSLFEYERDEVLGRRPYTDLAAFVYPEERELVMQQLAEHGSIQALEINCRTSTGRAIVVEISGRIIEIAGESCVLAMLADVTARKHAESKIKELAYLDTLTLLPNRRLLSDRIQQVMASMKRSKLYGAVVYLDLDNFKPLNDTHGHEMGDLLLIEAAQRLKATVRESDTVSRVGGDEFVLLIGELDSDLDRSMQRLRTIAEKVLTALAAPYLLANQKNAPFAPPVEHRCTASLGVAILSPEDVDYKVVLSHADAAMYEAKRSGKNSIQFWTADAGT